MSSKKNGGSDLPKELALESGKNMELECDSVIRLGPIDEDKLFQVVVETPRGSRNKYDYEPKSGLFELNTVLPAGMSFPYDFGFLPSTHCADGDPLDVLVLTDEPTFAGCLVRCRIVGILEAKQSEKGSAPYRNDRLLAVHHKSVLYSNIHDYRDLPPMVRHQVEHFFKAYNEAKNKKFEPIGWFGPDRAYSVIEQSLDAYDREKAS